MPSAIAPRIEVHGLAEFRAALRREERRTPAEVTRTLREIGTEMKRSVRQKMDRTFTIPRSRRTGRLRQDLHVTTKTGEMQLTFGRSSPQAGWWEFGGNSKTPPPFRERVKSGRTVYPTLREMRPEIELRMDLLLTRVAIDLESNPPTGVR